LDLRAWGKGEAERIEVLLFSRLLCRVLLPEHRLAEGQVRKQAVPFLKKRDPKNFLNSSFPLPSLRRRPSPLRATPTVMRTHDPMGFARARREIVTLPHGATSKSFLLLFFKKEALACFRPLLSTILALRAF
jgi:hypothetical protein